MTYYAVISDDAIMGIGTTPDAALDHMEEFTGPDSRDLYSSIEVCTPALAHQVRTRGGAAAYGQLRDGTLCTCAEEEAACEANDN